MGWKLIGCPKTTLVNPGLVEEFSTMDAAPGDRSLSERRLLVYRKILAMGQFRPVTWASAACNSTNNTYRINGKHTSIMLSSIRPLPVFYVTTERYQCDTLQDVANLYGTFDSRLMARTTADINQAFAATIPELTDIPARLISLTVTAAAYLKWGEQAKGIPAQERAEELVDEFPFTVWLHKLFPSSAGKRTSGASSYYHLVRGPVVTAMLETWRKAPRKATDFWAAVRDESAPDKDDPTRVLGRWLIRVTLAKGGITSADKTKTLVDFREMYSRTVTAWNAWLKGERTVLRYYPNADVPTALKA